MAYGMQQLRKAGKALQDFDRDYADRARADFGGEQKAPLKSMLGGTPLSEPVQDFKADGPLGTALGYATIAGIYGSNAGYRYGLPAAGLTLAGKGLYDLTAQFGNAADYQEPGQLSL